MLHRTVWLSNWENLDPFRMHVDVKLREVLEICRIKEEIEAAGGLDVQVKDLEASYSVGQLQLLFLGRAFFKSSKVLFLDERTANFDTQAASILQNVISSECQGMAVITIAHWISTVLSMDKIFVLGKGILAYVILSEERWGGGKLSKEGTMQLQAMIRASIWCVYARTESQFDWRA